MNVILTFLVLNCLGHIHDVFLLCGNMSTHLFSLFLSFCHEYRSPSISRCNIAWQLGQTGVVINQTDQKEIYRQLLDDHQVNMPHYQEEIQVTGEIITDLGSGNWKTLQVDDNDYFASFIIYLEGNSLPILEGNVTVDGRSLGVIRADAGSGGRVLYLIAETITQNGEVIYNRGGSDND